MKSQCTAAAKVMEYCKSVPDDEKEAKEDCKANILTCNSGPGITVYFTKAMNGGLDHRGKKLVPGIVSKEHWRIKKSSRRALCLPQIINAIFSKDGARKNWKLYYAVTKQHERELKQRVDAALSEIGFDPGPQGSFRVCSATRKPNLPFIYKMLTDGGCTSQEQDCVSESSNLASNDADSDADLDDY